MKKIILLLGLLAFPFCNLKLYAQDKYDFLIVEYKTWYGVTSISLNGKELIIEKVELPKAERNSMNANPFLKKVNEYQEKGWEVMSFNSTIATSYPIMDEVYFAFLRKKRKE